MFAICSSSNQSNRTARLLIGTQPIRAFKPDTNTDTLLSTHFQAPKLPPISCDFYSVEGL